MEQSYNYTVYFDPQPDGGFNVIIPAIPEICTFGENLVRAREMAQDAIRCYIESAQEHGERIPSDIEATKEKITVAV